MNAPVITWVTRSLTMSRAATPKSAAGGFHRQITNSLTATLASALEAQGSPEGLEGGGTGYTMGRLSAIFAEQRP